MKDTANKIIEYWRKRLGTDATARRVPGAPGMGGFIEAGEVPPEAEELVELASGPESMTVRATAAALQAIADLPDGATFAAARDALSMARAIVSDAAV